MKSAIARSWLAAKPRSAPLFPASGGLIAYGPDGIDQYRRAAGYVDRVLKGEKPADLLVQAPTRPRSSSA
ncbi:MAG: hypothetical protein WA729_16915 [Pseudolabrys sp.]